VLIRRDRKLMIMKKLLFFLAIFGAFAFQEVSASHYAGGDIQYRYIGDSTGVANQYLILCRIYRDQDGIPMPNQITVNVCSSCYASQSITCPLVGGGPGVIAPTLFDCVDPNAPGTVDIEIYIYQGVVTLAGQCSDWIFSHGICCRNGVINNIVTPSSQGFYIEAKLNNFLGNNTSPFFVSEPVRAFCVGNVFNWKQSAIEPDGDSIRYTLTNVKDDQGACNYQNITYAAGFTLAQPISTNPPQSLYMDPVTGIITFEPSTVEVDVLAVLVEEYRFDSTYFQWVKIASSERDMQITISPTCSFLAQQGVILDYNAPGYYPDPITGLPTVDYTCLDSAVVLKFAVKLDCSSISPDGTDFRLTAPNDQPIPIKEMVSICDANNETDSILVKLHKPLAFNGDYFIYSKTGNDGNTLLNKCGFPMDEFDTIQLRVDGCFTTNIDMRNVTVVEDEYPRAEWSLDTVGTPSAPFPNYLVDEYKIFRSDDGGANYTQVYTISDYKNMFFNDQSLNWADVDAQSYKYRVEVVVNSTSAGVTRNIHSILLESMTDPNMKNDSIDLFWNSYNGWPGAEYTVELGTLEGSIWTWLDHSNPGSPDNPTLDSVYLMINEGLQPGDYAARVRANYPGGAGPDSAYSNWIRWSVLEPPIPPIVDPIEPEVPNVMTPNNDGNNDLFIIENIETWSSTRNVTIFNRWGNVVFESGSYTNETPWDGTDQSGKQLADGVYFYMVDLSDQPSGKTFQKNGQVTLMGGIN
jgi:gliding motility-associated-like protein